MYDTENKKFIVPAIYDEIIFANFDGFNGGYVLRNGNKYGVFIYDNPNNTTIAPVFDKTLLLVNYNYFGKKMPLFKLYDNNGQLFCYANQTGKQYFKP